VEKKSARGEYSAASIKWSRTALLDQLDRRINPTESCGQLAGKEQPSRNANDLALAKIPARRRRFMPRKAVAIEEGIRELALLARNRLKVEIEGRMDEMQEDDTSHFLIYSVLGISTQEGKLIDEYQNKGRFLYKYAGSFLEAAAKLCFLKQFPTSRSARILNTQSRRPKTFQIDCLLEPHAIEIKWRDATTDGDHITKEHSRIQAIVDAKYIPVRVMFYYPNREQAMRIQRTLETLYRGVGGEYHRGEQAWNYVKSRTGVDLLAILAKIAKENAVDE
jgi:hypothetical protein